MKKILLIISLSIISINLKAQNISGSYRWILADGERIFEISLSPKNAILSLVPQIYQGKHCGVFEHGRRMDCSMEEYSILIQKTGSNTFTGTILSAYSNTISEIKITYIQSSGNLRWEVTKQSNGQNYFPLDVILEKDQGFSTIDNGLKYSTTLHS